VGQLQQLDAFLNAGLVGGLAPRDVAQLAVLLDISLSLDYVRAKQTGRTLQPMGPPGGSRGNFAGRFSKF
jgi:hypothetical protein